MRIWEELGITPTTDKRAIKKAYAAKVKECHQEDHPQEWMQLHEAYQTALRFAEGEIRIIYRSVPEPKREEAHQPAEKPEREEKHQPTELPIREEEHEPAELPIIEEEHEPTEIPEREEKHEPAELPIIEEAHEPAELPEREEEHQSTELPIIEEEHEPAELPEREEEHQSTELPIIEEEHESAELPEREEEHQSTEKPGIEEEHESAELPIIEEKHEPTELPIIEEEHEPTESTEGLQEEAEMQKTFLQLEEMAEQREKELLMKMQQRIKEMYALPNKRIIIEMHNIMDSWEAQQLYANAEFWKEIYDFLHKKVYRKSLYRAVLQDVQLIEESVAFQITPETKKYLTDICRYCQVCGGKSLQEKSSSLVTRIRQKKKKEIAGIVVVACVSIIVVVMALQQWTVENSELSTYKVQTLMAKYLNEKYDGLEVEPANFRVNERRSTLYKEGKAKKVQVGYEVTWTEEEDFFGYVLVEYNDKNKVEQYVCFDNRQNEEIEDALSCKIQEILGTDGGTGYLGGQNIFVDGAFSSDANVAYHTSFEGDMDNFFEEELSIREKIYQRYGSDDVQESDSVWLNGSFYYYYQDPKYATTRQLLAERTGEQIEDDIAFEAEKTTEDDSELSSEQQDLTTRQESKVDAETLETVQALDALQSELHIQIGAFAMPTDFYQSVFAEGVADTYEIFRFNRYQDTTDEKILRGLVLVSDYFLQYNDSTNISSNADEELLDSWHHTPRIVQVADGVYLSECYVKDQYNQSALPVPETEVEQAEDEIHILVDTAEAGIDNVYMIVVERSTYGIPDNIAVSSTLEEAGVSTIGNGMDWNGLLLINREGYVKGDTLEIDVTWDSDQRL
jgi:hypothetical protein